MYYVYTPTFSINSAGRLVARFAISTSNAASAPAEPTFMAQQPSGGSAYGVMFTLGAGYYPWNATGDGCFLQLGCAVTADGSNGYVPPAQSDVVAVGSPLPMAGSASNSVSPVISFSEITAQLDIPQQPSTFSLAFKISGGTQTRFLSATTWYGHTGEQAAFPFDFPFPVLSTWYSPAVAFSASPVFAKNGGTSALTIAVPNSLRTLTASDFTVTGGTLSNFTKVS